VRVTPETVADLVAFHFERRDAVYDFLERLSVEELRRSVNLPWRSILGVLLHCLESEDFWVQHALQDLPWPRYEPNIFANLPAVRHVAASVTESTKTYSQGLTAAKMAEPVEVTFVSGGKVTTTPGEVLVHVVTHAIYHRGQVMAAAAQMGYEPPDLGLL
jgi:uncharacterized damage-inducible protein DinB